MNKLSVLILILFLTSCSNNPNSVARTPSAVTNSLYNFKGQNIDTAFSVLGLPDKQLNVYGNEVFIWEKGDDKWYCSVKLSVGNDKIIKSVDIDASTVYKCPAGIQ